MKENRFRKVNCLLCPQKIACLQCNSNDHYRDKNSPLLDLISNVYKHITVNMLKSGIIIVVL
jgi:hypothetical protein